MSAQGEAEWRTFTPKTPSGEGGLVVPVRVEEAEAARLALLAAARGVRGKPAVEPGFPGRPHPPSAAEQPQFPAELPPTWNVPPRPTSGSTF